MILLKYKQLGNNIFQIKDEYGGVQGQEHPGGGHHTQEAKVNQQHEPR